jgi:uncharacterized protein
LLDIPFLKKTVTAKIGSFLFELRSITPDKIDRRAKYRWARHDIFGMHPRFQFLGPEAQDIVISGVCYPAFGSGIGHMAKLRELADTGEPQRFIYADTALGQNLGLWVITSVSEVRTHLIDGLPQKIEFTVELSSYEKQAAA